MEIFKRLEPDIRTLYSSGYFSGNYDQSLYLKRAVDDGSHKPKFYISVISIINGEPRIQGYLYFYLDFEEKRSNFIGMAVNPEYRNLDIASLLLASWIDLCKNNGVETFGVNHKQKKPFLIYLLKKYGFEVSDLKLYKKSPDVITLYRSPDCADTSKVLMFKTLHHEEEFIRTNIYKTDNYKIIHTPSYYMKLDRIILPFQSITLSPVNYELRDEHLALEKTSEVITKHKKGI